MSDGAMCFYCRRYRCICEDEVTPPKPIDTAEEAVEANRLSHPGGEVGEPVSPAVEKAMGRFYRKLAEVHPDLGWKQEQPKPEAAPAIEQGGSKGTFYFYCSDAEAGVRAICTIQCKGCADRQKEKLLGNNYGYPPTVASAEAIQADISHGSTAPIEGGEIPTIISCADYTHPLYVTPEEKLLRNPRSKPEPPQAEPSESAGSKNYDDCSMADAQAAEQYAIAYVCKVGVSRETMIDAISTLRAQVLSYEAKQSQPAIEPQLMEAINWLMGCGDSDFVKPAGATTYWFRSEFKKHAGLEYDGDKYVLPSDRQRFGKKEQ